LLTGHVLACPVVNRTSVSCSRRFFSPDIRQCEQWRNHRADKGHTRSGHRNRRDARRIFRGWGPPWRLG